MNLRKIPLLMLTMAITICLAVVSAKAQEGEGTGTEVYREDIQISMTWGKDIGSGPMYYIKIIGKFFKTEDCLDKIPAVTYYFEDKNTPGYDGWYFQYGVFSISEGRAGCGGGGKSRINAVFVKIHAAQRNNLMPISNMDPLFIEDPKVFMEIAPLFNMYEGELFNSKVKSWNPEDIDTEAILYIVSKDMNERFGENTLSAELYSYAATPTPSPIPPTNTPSPTASNTATASPIPPTNTPSPTASNTPTDISTQTPQKIETQEVSAETDRKEPTDAPLVLPPKDPTSGTDGSGNNIVTKILIWLLALFGFGTAAFIVIQRKNKQTPT